MLGEFLEVRFANAKLLQEKYMLGVLRPLLVVGGALEMKTRTSYNVELLRASRVY